MKQVGEKGYPYKALFGQKYEKCGKIEKKALFTSFVQSLLYKRIEKIKTKKMSWEEKNIHVFNRTWGDPPKIAPGDYMRVVCLFPF